MGMTDQRRRQSRTAAVVRDALHLDLTSKRCILGLNDCQLFAVPSVTYGMIAVNGREIYLHQETWDTIRAGGAECIDSFFASFMRPDASDGLRFLTSGIPWWADAVRAEAEKDGADLVHAKDRLTLLEERLVQLAAMAGDFGGANADREHLKMFASALGDCQSDLVEAEARLRHMRGLMMLAETVVSEL